uniref:Uncharacterized protein n=1 Tax=Nelumbo nucifera TaxID=4432 RepID=A0A822ZLI9_NELNU|nr:TPA_asm: hypothetical protein HUJ06_003997 [Nelumbo nucifera]
MANPGKREKFGDGSPLSNPTQKSGSNSTKNVAQDTPGGSNSNNEWEDRNKRFTDARNNSDYRATGPACMCLQKQSSSSNLYKVCIKSEGQCCCSSSRQEVPGKTEEADCELKLIENIDDILGSAELQHLLFQGHENENIARNFLHPEIGSNVANQDDRIKHKLAPHSQVIGIISALNTTHLYLPASTNSDINLKISGYIKKHHHPDLLFTII